MKLKSFTITELLIALAVFAILSSSIIFVIIDALESSRASKDRTIAVNLAQEGLEAVRNIRNQNYNLLENGTYGLTVSGNTWQLSPTPEIIQDRFTRSIVVDDYADNEKKIIVDISWNQRANRNLKVSFETILANWKESTPTKPKPWSRPFFASSLDLSGNSDALDVFVVNNIAYLVRANSNRPELSIIDVNNPQNPNLLNSLELGNTGNRIIVAENYAYIVSNHDTQEIQIINISDPNHPNLVSSYNAPGNANIYGIAIQNNVLYMTRASSNQDEFLSLDIKNPSAPRLLDSLNLNATARDLIILGNYAYVTGSHNNQELQIVNISNPRHLGIEQTYNLPGNQDAFSIQNIDNQNILVGRSNVNNGPELYILDISELNNIQVVSTYETDERINNIAYGPDFGLAFLATRNSALEFQVIENALNTPAIFGSLDLDAVANGIFFSEPKSTIYIASSSNSQELIILLPQEP